ncbi:hypothetical protein BK026_02225 [Alteromonas sp. V450]|uniref:hypothetical protein n=1 Tax=Alteromonas sp. V450 TaxID=1912139 RepID=UPI0008FF47CA|nr:hypothetical protein [Alteromonas sp. V450]OJF67695.1 hypothetical protein BK026_02225 [Alteromonas sp. V450]
MKLRKIPYITWLFYFNVALELIKTLFPKDHVVFTGKVSLISIFFFCYLVLFTNRWRIVSFKYYRAPFIFFGLFLLSAILSSLNQSILLVLGQLLLHLKLPLLLFACYQYKFPSFTLKNIESGLVVFLGANLVTCIYSVLSPASYQGVFEGAFVGTVVQGTQFSRASGLFYHPGPMGVFVCFTAVIFFCRWLYDKKYMYALGFLFSSAALLLSGQRLELSALVFILISAWFLKRSPKLLITKYYFIGLIAFSFFSFTLIFIEGDLLSGSAMENNVRVILYQSSITLANYNFPFGNGLGSFGSSMSLGNPNAAYNQLGFGAYWWFSAGKSYLTDTYWAMIIGESGYIGFFFNLLFIFSLLFQRYLRVRFSPKPENLISVMLLILTLPISINAPVYTGSVIPLLLVAMYTGRHFKSKSMFNEVK